MKGKMKTKIDLDDFTRGYVLAAFWTNDDDAPSGDYAQSGRFEVMFEKLSPEALEKMQSDCTQFQAEQSAHLEACGLNSKRAGHDFWLTRNGHGSGFWNEDGRRPARARA